MVILDLVEQAGNLAAADGGELAGAQFRVDVAVQQRDNVVARAQPIAFDMALEPGVDHSTESFALGLDCWQSSTHAREDATRLLARRLDAHRVGQTDEAPGLLAL